MSCVFVVEGVQLDVDSFLSNIQLKPNPYRIDRKGDPGLLGGDKWVTNAIYCDASEASMSQFMRQQRDAEQFLKRNRAQILKMNSLQLGVHDCWLDFGIELKNVTIPCEVFCPSLCKAAGELGIGLMFSVYPAAS